ncbi:phage portal protein [Cesiribacter andamanensis]|uniref:Phage portal protein, HK97 family n=1 Tax=Cesiribacter andamanensis AMV16 TaxID=1279009 RepID=M7NL48_9BACT|nr:phage portal protein [Cesiribacter andamanensis]EMR02520.1 phage portal protein, HK97 family [Cesiribacter andamanensis AMV16]
MSWLKSLFSYGGEQRSQPVKLSQIDNWQSFFLGGGAVTSSGQLVTRESAMRWSPVYACIRIISENMASVPLKVYKSTPTGKEVDKTNPLYRLLHSEPNPLMSSFTWRQIMQVDLLTEGNAYSIIHRRGSKVTALEYVPAGKVATYPQGDSLTYEIEKKRYKHTDILHVTGLGWDGVKGMSPIEYAREAIGLGMASEKYGADYFGQGATLSGILTTEATLNPDQRTALKAAWYEEAHGKKNNHATKVLGGGMKYQRIGNTPEESQNVQIRRFQLEEVARIFGIPNHLLNNLENASFSNIEMQSSEFVMYCLRPHAARWESELQRKLFPNDDTFAEFSLDGLLRANAKDRAELYKGLFNVGAIDSNTIAKLENLEGTPDGNRRYVHKDMIPADLIEKYLLQTKNGKD